MDVSLARYFLDLVGSVGGWLYIFDITGFLDTYFVVFFIWSILEHGIVLSISVSSLYLTYIRNYFKFKLLVWNFFYILKKKFN